MRAIIIFLLHGFFSLANAQLTIVLEAIPTTTPVNAEIFVAGNFNQWNPGNTTYKFTKNSENKYTLTFSPNPGKLEFKFTRGSWNTVEGNINGNYIPNRSYQYNGMPTTLSLNIAGWEGVSTNPSTASPQVSVMNDSFYMPNLDRYRKIWLYLPKDYTNSSKQYPVLYMHDGQNLFDRTTAFSGEWKVDETLDSLFDNGDYGCIVVGIENGGSKRLDEYSPWTNSQYGGGEGDQYIDFILNELKPYIDQHYRTKTEPENTAMIGSSMGGLITLYAGLKHADVFGLLGPLSSAYWFSPSSYAYADSKDYAGSLQKIYMMAGGKEGGNQVGDMYKMRDVLIENNFKTEYLLAEDHVNDGHNENYWSREFPNVYKWLFDKTVSTNSTSKINYNVTIVDDSLCVEGDFQVNDKLSLFDMNGRKIWEHQIVKNNPCFKTKNLNLSTYLVNVHNASSLKYSKKLLLGN